MLADSLRTINGLIEQPPETKGERRRVAATLKRIRDELGAVLNVVGVGGDDPRVWLAQRRDRLAAERGIDIGWVEEQIETRTTAKTDRNFAQADAIREDLNSRGIELLDTRAGTVWRLTESTP